ncbi:MAG TPA: prolipoprotein diacylglyceryl transferase family protein [Bellilinea sp.]|nr:prolipoprotein diacylglyceryl transferase family protein [Bellilinea sp.]
MNGYSLLIGIGAALGLLQVIRRVPDNLSLRWTVAGLGMLIAGLAGARAAYVWLNPGYYSLHPQAVWQLTEGGLAWPGALSGVLAAFFLAALFMRVPLGVSADVFAPMIVTVAITCWLGAAFSGTAYGASIHPALPWAIPSTEPEGVLTYRWPLQLTAALTLFLLHWSFERQTADSRLPDVRASMVGLLLAGHTALFSYWRADGGLVFNGLRVDYAAAGLLGALCLVGLIIGGFVRMRASFSDEAPGANRETWFSPRE